MRKIDVWVAKGFWRNCGKGIPGDIRSHEKKRKSQRILAGGCWCAFAQRRKIAREKC